MKAVAALFVFCLVSLSAWAGLENFDSTPVGSLPPGWVGGVTGEGQADWRVVVDTNAPSAPHVLQQSGSAKFCWCVNTNLSIKNGRLDVRFKPISGRDDKAGGLIWRFQDCSNYYVVRANAEEDNITIYKTVQGVRREYGRTKMKVLPNQWHTLRVEFAGPRFTVAFDNEFALAWDDDTFINAGAVGVWTKADSVTAFDDFRCDDAGANP
ncbi:MAG TPA: hypothetical protein VHB20_15590 [Verrucomicrobiae bacterium]|jgi:hypothetical protein|nr:hypothetical protein [Verrucomicrobiae bacterium]